MARHPQLRDQAANNSNKHVCFQETHQLLIGMTFADGLCRGAQTFKHKTVLEAVWEHTALPEGTSNRLVVRRSLTLAYVEPAEAHQRIKPDMGLNNSNNKYLVEKHDLSGQAELVRYTHIAQDNLHSSCSGEEQGYCTFGRI